MISLHWSVILFLFCCLIFLRYRINRLEDCLAEILAWTKFKNTDWAKRAKKLLNFKE